MSLIQRNLSNIEIKATFSCGTSRVTRIRKLMDDPNLAKVVRKPPAHAVKKQELDDLKNHIMSYGTEMGLLAHIGDLVNFLSNKD